VSVSSPQWGLFLFISFLFYFSLLCAFGHLVVAEVGVIGIFAILVYSLYPKNDNINYTWPQQ
jgi:hypothetical protein